MAKSTQNSLSTKNLMRSSTEQDELGSEYFAQLYENYLNHSIKSTVILEAANHLRTSHKAIVLKVTSNPISFHLPVRIQELFIEINRNTAVLFDALQMLNLTELNIAFRAVFDALIKCSQFDLNTLLETSKQKWNLTSHFEDLQLIEKGGLCRSCSTNKQSSKLKELTDSLQVADYLTARSINSQQEHYIALQDAIREVYSTQNPNHPLSKEKTDEAIQMIDHILVRRKSIMAASQSQQKKILEKAMVQDGKKSSLFEIESHSLNRQTPATLDSLIDKTYFKNKLKGKLMETSRKFTERIHEHAIDSLGGNRTFEVASTQTIYIKEIDVIANLERNINGLKRELANCHETRADHLREIERLLDLNRIIEKRNSEMKASIKILEKDLALSQAAVQRLDNTLKATVVEHKAELEGLVNRTIATRAVVLDPKPKYSLGLCSSTVEQQLGPFRREFKHAKRNAVQQKSSKFEDLIQQAQDNAPTKKQRKGMILKLPDFRQRIMVDVETNTVPVSQKNFGISTDHLMLKDSYRQHDFYNYNHSYNDSDGKLTYNSRARNHKLKESSQSWLQKTKSALKKTETENDALDTAVPIKSSRVNSSDRKRCAINQEMLKKSIITSFQDRSNLQSKIIDIRTIKHAIRNQSKPVNERLFDALSTLTSRDYESKGTESHGCLSQTIGRILIFTKKDIIDAYLSIKHAEQFQKDGIHPEGDKDQLGLFNSHKAIISKIQLYVASIRYSDPNQYAQIMLFLAFPYSYFIRLLAHEKKITLDGISECTTPIESLSNTSKIIIDERFCRSVEKFDVSKNKSTVSPNSTLTSNYNLKEMTNLATMWQNLSAHSDKIRPVSHYLRSLVKLHSLVHRKCNHFMNIFQKYSIDLNE